MNHPFALATSLVLAIPLLAQQQKVLPPGMDHVEGPLVYTYPFGRADGAMQVLVDGDRLTLSQGVITGISFRPSQVTSAQVGTGYTKNYRITAYTVTRPASMMVADPVTNIGGATGTVVFNGPVTLPGSGVLALQPAPFLIPMPFSAPYPFDGTQGNLLLLVETTDLTPVPSLYRIDAVNFRNTQITGLVSDIDLTGGCPGAGGSLSIVTSEAQAILGGVIDTTITSSATGAFPVALATLSLTWQPTDLTTFGLTGCTSFGGLGFALQFLLENGGGGYPHALWNLPIDPIFEGVPLYTQVLGIPPTNTLTGAALSQGQAIRVGSSSFPPQKMMAAFRSSTGWFIGTAGEFTPVILFDGVFP